MIDVGSLPYLKQVSRVKHHILKSYLEPWAKILGSAHDRLGYVDCFAGGGLYRDEKGAFLPGSPIIALRLAKDYVQKHPSHRRMLSLVEENHKTAEQLREVLRLEEPVPSSIKYSVVEEDAQDFGERLVETVKSWGAGSRLIPTFFFVDPYGHPITIPLIRELLSLGQTEVLVNLMWYQVSRDLANPKMTANLDRLFGHSDWGRQTFMRLEGIDRERAFAEYLAQEVGAPYHLRFPVRFSPEDRVPGGDRRTKFCLTHFASHPKAALLMKEVMWAASDDVAELRFSGHKEDTQLRLFGTEPDLDGLRTELLRQFEEGQETFDDIRIKTLDLPFIAKHYRTVLKQLERDGVVHVTRVESKRSGLKGKDTISFP